MAGLGSAIVLLADTAGDAPGAFQDDLSDGFNFRLDDPVATKRYAVTYSVGIGVQPVQTPVIRPGRIISEVIRMQLATTPNLNWTWTVNEQIHMAQALHTAAGAGLSDVVHVHPALSMSIAVTILQGIGILPTPLPTLNYTMAVMETLRMSSSLTNFFGSSLVDGIGMHAAAPTYHFKASPILADTVGLHPVLSGNWFLAVNLDDEVGFDENNILHMIYNGQLTDDINIVAGYVAPDGNFTTWAINTRSGATTEYQNYAFNSFARLGNRYLGASTNGLYFLDGHDDDDADIIADIKSGFTEWGGSRFTMFKAAYLGTRGGGDFVLKIITADGREYDYAVSARHMRTTKINVGKGIRTRYFAFELISTGQDFDLDTIEFVPLVSERRV